MAVNDPRRREIWDVNFDRTRGDEIRRLHPALVMNVRNAGRLRLRLVVPITSGNPQFLRHFWMVGIRANATNGLDHDSFADTFQLKSVSTDRFVRKRGEVTSDDLLQEVLSAIALCIGLTAPGRTA